jgi:crossover junction endodeoxyribonuclease RuvC
MGVDPSTYTGIIVLDGDTVVCRKVINFPEVEGYKRLQLIAREFMRLVRMNTPRHIFIEQQIFGGKFNHAVQGQISALLRMSLFEYGEPWYDVTPTTLKKWATGSGKADKKQMKSAVLAKWGFDSKSDDEVDAYAIARLGQFVVGSPSPTIKGVNKGV